MGRNGGEAHPSRLMRMARSPGLRAWLMAVVALVWVAGTVVRVDDVCILAHRDQPVGSVLSQSFLGFGMSALFTVAAVREFHRSH